MSTATSGTFYGFIKDGDEWNLAKFDSMDNAFSLCTFEDRDLQCDFNSPFWEVQDCSWRSNKSLIKDLGSDTNETFTRILAQDENNYGNYWRPSNSKSDNFLLVGDRPGKYHLVSPILRESGPRQHDPHFGFVFRGDKSQIKVSIVENLDVTKVHLIFELDVEANIWTYYGKNLSEVQFIKDSWSQASVTQWQIVMEFIVDVSGNIAIDNLGPCALEEVFFPRSPSSGKMIGSCYRIEVIFQWKMIFL